MRSHGFFTVEDRLGRRWRYARWHRWFTFGEPALPPIDDTDGTRVPIAEAPPWTVHVGAEWCHLAGFGQYVAVGGKISTSGEETLDVAWSLGRLLHHYLKIDVEHHGHQVRLRPAFRVTGEVGLTEASWCFGPDDHSWHSRASWAERLRRNRLRWVRVYWYRRDQIILDETDTVVPLPEGEYPVHLTLHENVWQVRVGPYRPTRRSRLRMAFWLPGLVRRDHSVDITSETGLPVPEKDNDYWTGAGDAIYGCGALVTRNQVETGQWRTAAVAQAIEAVNRHRVRHGRGVTDTGRRTP